MKRLLLLLIVVGVVLYLVKTQNLFHKTPSSSETERGSPIERARAAARASDQRTAAGEAAKQEADQPQGGSVTENMTPDQVRKLLGPPDETSTDTTGSGASRETWVYRSVGKSVVFENGVVLAVQ
ncbi:MAG TPA: hypothetical protein VGO79_10750 [Thermoanaerobaculia bacterium]|jgi:hypothetical protein